MKITFAGLVQYQFQFLVNEYAFTLLVATESPRGEFWEGDVQYETPSTYIKLSCTRGETPSLWLGRTKDQKENLMPIQVIYEYVNLSEEQKRIVLTVSEERRARSILRDKQISHLISQSGSTEENVRTHLTNYANCLRNFGAPFLKSDFSLWLDIWEYHIKKLVVENARAGRPEFVPVVVTDKSGQNRAIGKQSVFKKSLDYINELKNETN